MDGTGLSGRNSIFSVSQWFIGGPFVAKRLPIKRAAAMYERSARARLSKELVEGVKDWGGSKSVDFGNLMEQRPGCGTMFLPGSNISCSSRSQKLEKGHVPAKSSSSVSSSATASTTTWPNNRLGLLFTSAFFPSFYYAHDTSLLTSCTTECVE
jgi:hypothetical protein